MKKERRVERAKMQKCLREKIGKGNRKAQKQAKHLHMSEHFNEKIAKLLNDKIFERSNITKKIRRFYRGSFKRFNTHL